MSKNDYYIRTRIKPLTSLASSNPLEICSASSISCRRIFGSTSDSSTNRKPFINALPKAVGR